MYNMIPRWNHRIVFLIHTWTVNVSSTAFCLNTYTKMVREQIEKKTNTFYLKQVGLSDIPAEHWQESHWTKFPSISPLLILFPLKEQLDHWQIVNLHLLFPQAQNVSYVFLPCLWLRHSMCLLVQLGQLQVCSAVHFHFCQSLNCNKVPPVAGSVASQFLQKALYLP